ncbi:hypothetical protein D0962_16880 [Leptolyngbyaceae cyanobacterium CCMR0082]|uniref:Uncharacterized protein n=2 Tax=Adonisia turfae TaxID=2950184 RepID=A0A6M0S8N5_9CYAN|nr:hypothetical protein [Adonisia turfae CCMR0081]NEZ64443.1 hypothetical protein [Adonisia turfae CCMR0082]
MTEADRTTWAISPQKRWGKLSRENLVTEGAVCGLLLYAVMHFFNSKLLQQYSADVVELVDTHA